MFCRNRGHLAKNRSTPRTEGAPSSDDPQTTRQTKRKIRRKLLNARFETGQGIIPSNLGCGVRFLKSLILRDLGSSSAELTTFW